MSDVQTAPSNFNSHLLPQNDDLDLLDWCQGRLTRARSDRLAFERQWILNLAFFFGKQNVQWVGSGLTGTINGYDRLIEPPVPPWRVRLVINKIRTIVRHELSKVTKENPRAFVIPASTEDKDLAAARAGEGIYEWLHRVLELKKVIRRAEFWSVITGIGFIKDWYDPESLDEAGVKGKIFAEPVSPFHLFVPDLEEEELEKQPWVCHVLGKDPEWVKATYKKDVQTDSESAPLDSRFLQAIGVTKQKNTLVSVKEMWIKPCPKFKEGAVVVWAGEQILAKTFKWPFSHRQYPFTSLGAIPTGRFYPDSVVTDLIPLQKEYNRTRSQIVEAKNRMAKPQLIAPRGSVDPNKITTEPGLIIQYTPGFAEPKPLPLQNLPSYVIQEVERIQVDMNDLSSQHEVTKGQTPPGVSAATAISYLQEADDSKLKSAVDMLEEGVEKLGRHLLCHVKDFWTAERKIQVLGSNGTWEAYEFSNSNIAGNTDLRIEAGSAQPVSRAAKQAFIMELMKNGYVPPERGLRYLDMAETAKLYDELQVDVRQAGRENLKIIQGVPVDVNDFDNHQVHLTEHNNFCKTQEFENADEEYKQWMMMHRTMHRQRIAQEMGGMISPGSPLPGGDSQQGGMMKPPGPMQLPSGPQPSLNGGPQ